MAPCVLEDHFPYASEEGFEEFELEKAHCVEENEVLRAGGKAGIDFYHAVTITIERNLDTPN